jgi:Activator of Hsp90 ATPase, N-terminal
LYSNFEDDSRALELFLNEFEIPLFISRKFASLLLTSSTHSSTSATTLKRSRLPAMVLHNPNNWHWVNKDASGWTKQWLEESIKEMKAEENGVSAQLDKVISMDGDVDVNQRKGKVITIFDVKVVIEYSGTFLPQKL